jgi:Holliday junction resolvasome RuvABC endonuclease subunit
MTGLPSTPKQILTGDPYIVGADLSSHRLAFVGGKRQRGWNLHAYELGSPFTAQVCGRAMDSTLSFLDEIDGSIPYQVERLCYIEAPVTARGGVKTTIVQAFVSGVVQACFIKAAFKVYLVNVSTWKKTVCGNGHATKHDVAKAVKQRWPEIRTDDQDLIDACGVLFHGLAVERSKRRLEAQGRL